MLQFQSINHQIFSLIVRVHCYQWNLKRGKWSGLNILESLDRPPTFLAEDPMLKASEKASSKDVCSGRRLLSSLLIPFKIMSKSNRISSANASTSANFWLIGNGVGREGTL